MPSYEQLDRSRSAPHLGFVPPSRESASHSLWAFGREFVTAIATEGGSPLGATEAVGGATRVTVAATSRPPLNSAIVNRCEPVNITRFAATGSSKSASCCRKKLVLRHKRYARTELPTTNPTRAPSIAAEYQEAKPLEQDRRGSRK